MSSFKTLVVAGAAAGLTVVAAHAADLPPPPIMQTAPVELSGWYLRGNIGMTNQQVKSGAFTPNPFPNDVISTQFMSFDSSPLFGLGVGYQVYNWLRVDATGEYRSNSHFHGQQVDRSTLPVQFADDYNASKSEWLFLANAYVDLGTWWCITPFVGAGIGTSRNTISSFTDIGNSIGLGVSSTTYADNHSQWNFAWALYAGLSYQVTPAFNVELTYRYVDLGSAQTGTAHAFDGSVIPTNPFVFKDITSSDVMLGLRWKLGEPAAPLPPYVRKG
jgi:opacity protein-like surface antigen